ncbi:outer membrane protein assembly factor BamA [Sulfuritalea sp.]|uniref:outer membrane protein assembly factor BamA n=1 Tax=Sulfuritalea sp. TaxID=2480090 RepID=UPI001AC72D35|nr:outer membrane protein assembly factor BamA [Sulfuritalea sp.]MBN8474686.1 outer membrane protein assembly factor BamA [Sulfuritalea sp.]
MNKKLLAGLISALLAHAAHAFDPFQIKDIRVEGIQRTEAGTVFSYLPVKVGDTMNDEKAAAAIKALFATGFFKDVRLEIDGQILVVVLEERPAIASLEFTGLKAFKPEDLKKSLRDVGLAESRIFDRAVVERAEQELKRQYLAQGHYAVQVTTTITPLERNRVGVNFSVNEGDIAKIKQINIIGAGAMSEADLLDLMVLRTSGWLTWYTKNDQYSKQKLSGDLETLRSHYLDRGYLEFNIDSTQVSISPDKQDIYITINLTEGERYTVSSVKLAGQMLLPEEELTKLVQVVPGEVFSREKMADTTKAISERLGNEGYAFANVNAAPELNKEKRQVAFTVFIDPGRRVYVRRINVSGNTRSRDEVIRREMRQVEGAWYDGEKINKSRTRVDRLGYFDEVTVETPAVAGATDQVDMEVKVKEKPTGNIMLGAGFSSAEKFTLSGSVQQQNLFGSGKHIGVQVSTSKSNQVYSLSHTDPYFTVDGVSQGFDIYTRKTDTSTLAVGSFGSDSAGGGVRWGLPIAEDDYLNVGLSIDRTTLKTDANSPLRYRNYVTTFGARSNTLLTTLGWQKDARDSLLVTTKGSLRRAVLEVSLPGSTATYVRATYQHQHFFPLDRRLTLAVNGEVGVASSYGNKDLPFFKNFYAGGIGSVRGFDSGSLGPRDTALNEAIGGDKRLIGNAELLFPVPGMGRDNSMRLSVFMDAGNVWGYDSKFSLGSLRYSGGVALAWNSPMGPLKFSYANPFNKKAEDKVQRLQFQMGSVF